MPSGLTLGGVSGCDCSVVSGAGASRVGAGCSIELLPSRLKRSLSLALSSGVVASVDAGILRIGLSEITASVPDQYSEISALGLAIFETILGVMARTISVFLF